MRARFIGKDGSRGFKRGEIYNVVTYIRGNYLWLSAVDVNASCPYTNMESLLSNWYIEFDDEPQIRAQNVPNVDRIAQQVLEQKWGNGTDRIKALTSAGYDYREVQAKVNELISLPKETSVEFDDNWDDF